NLFAWMRPPQRGRRGIIVFLQHRHLVRCFRLTLLCTDDQLHPDLHGRLLHSGDYRSCDYSPQKENLPHTFDVPKIPFPPHLPSTSTTAPLPPATPVFSLRSILLPLLTLYVPASLIGFCSLLPIICYAPNSLAETRR